MRSHGTNRRCQWRGRRRRLHPVVRSRAASLTTSPLIKISYRHQIRLGPGFSARWRPPETPRTRHRHQSREPMVSKVSTRQAVAPGTRVGGRADPSARPLRSTSPRLVRRIRPAVPPRIHLPRHSGWLHDSARQHPPRRHEPILLPNCVRPWPQGRPTMRQLTVGRPRTSLHRRPGQSTTRS